MSLARGCEGVVEGVGVGSLRGTNGRLVGVTVAPLPHLRGSQDNERTHPLPQHPPPPARSSLCVCVRGVHQRGYIPRNAPGTVRARLFRGNNSPSFFVIYEDTNATDGITSQPPFHVPLARLRDDATAIPLVRLREEVV